MSSGGTASFVLQRVVISFTALWVNKKILHVLCFIRKEAQCLLSLLPNGLRNIPLKCCHPGLTERIAVY